MIGLLSGLRRGTAGAGMVAREVLLRKGITFLFVVVGLLLMPAPAALAQGQAKVPVCHLDENGDYVLINIADPALDAHRAHGDLVVGEDVNENCEPLAPVAQAGCFAVTFLSPEKVLYALTDGSPVQFVDRQPLYSDASCTIPSEFFFRSEIYLIWAATQAEAEALCNGQVFTTPTPNLYLGFCS